MLSSSVVTVFQTSKGKFVYSPFKDVLRILYGISDSDIRLVEYGDGTMKYEAFIFDGEWGQGL